MKTSLTLLVLLASVRDGSSLQKVEIRQRAMDALYASLFSNGGQPRLFSLTKPNKPVRVDFLYDIIHIKEINAKDQTITTYGWVRQEWHHPYMRWNASEFDGIKEVMVDSSQIWVPDVTLYNNINEQDHKAGGRSTYKTDVNIYSDGRAVWRSPAIFKSTCDVYVMYFPFDKQTCYLRFSSWRMDSSKMELRVLDLSNSYGKHALIKNGEWKLMEDIKYERRTVHYPCCPASDYEEVAVVIKVSRQYFSYLVNLVIPCFMISSLIVLAFILPAGSGERVGLTITILLSLTFFQQLTMSIFPSFEFPLLGQYYLATYVVNGLAMFLITIVIKVENMRDDWSMPQWLKCLMFDWLATLVCLRQVVKRTRPKKTAFHFEERQAQQTKTKRRTIAHSATSKESNINCKSDRLQSDDIINDTGSQDEEASTFVGDNPRRGLVNADHELSMCDWERMMSVRILDRFFLGILAITGALSLFGILYFSRLFVGIL